jgi:hypothetical protein
MRHINSGKASSRESAGTVLTASLQHSYPEINRKIFLITYL